MLKGTKLKKAWQSGFAAAVTAMAEQKDQKEIPIVDILLQFLNV